MPPKSKAASRKAASASTAPRKTVPTSTASVQATVVCSVCCQPIVDGKDQALFCDGICQKWSHRYCVGVPSSHFEALSSSDKPFLCYLCCQSAQEEQLSDMKRIIDHLKEEVSCLKSTLKLRDGDDGSKPVESDTAQGLSSFVDIVTRGDVVTGNDRGVRGPGRGRGVRGRSSYRKRASRPSGEAARVGGHSTDSGQGHAKFPSMRAKSSTKGVSVCGARRIWGTLKATTTRAVEKVISTFSTTPVIVKRKYKSFNTPGSITKKSQRWWFVVRAEESVLVQLERDWESIEVQTGWQLTPLLHYVAVTDDVNIVGTHQAASHNDKLSFSTRQPTVSVDNGDQPSSAQVVSRDTSDSIVQQSLQSDTSLSCLTAEQQPSTSSSMNSSFHLTSSTNASSLEPASDVLNSVSEPFLGSLLCQ